MKLQILAQNKFNKGTRETQTMGKNVRKLFYVKIYFWNKKRIFFLFV